MNLDKSRIAQRFAKATHSYTDQASVQKIMSQQLYQYMLQYCPVELHRILEIGCGSGNLTKQLVPHFQIEQLYLNDLYPEVKQHFSDEFPAKWMIGDIEQMDLPSSLDAIVSSSVLQWMTDLPELLKHCHTALGRAGWLCFATFGADNFCEIKQLTGRGLEYWSLNDWKQQLTILGFEVLVLEQQHIQLKFDSPKAILKHLKATGVTAASAQQHRWNKTSLQDFYQNYQKFQDDHGKYSLTYHPIYSIVRSKI